jgi:hypothetical protein
MPHEAGSARAYVRCQTVPKVRSTRGRAVAIYFLTTRAHSASSPRLRD